MDEILQAALDAIDALREDPDRTDEQVRSELNFIEEYARDSRDKWT